MQFIIKRILFAFFFFFFIPFSFCQNWELKTLNGIGNGESNIEFADENVIYSFYNLSNPLGGGSHGSEYHLRKSLDCMQTYGEVKTRSGSMGCYYLSDMHFFNKDTGVIAEGCQGGTTFYKTTDGGATWQLSGGGGALSTMTFVNQDIGFSVYKSSGGQNILKRIGTPLIWYNAPYDFEHNDTVKTRIEFVTDSIGFITCKDSLGNGLVLKTTNIGSNWGEILTMIGAQFNDIDFCSETEGVIVGNAGLLLRTNDSGQNWTTITIPISNRLNAVSFGNDTLGYAGSSDGTLLNTMDGGLTWAIDTSWNVNSEIIAIKTFNEVCYISTATGIYRRGAPCIYTKVQEIEEEENINIYPNPTTNLLTIELPSKIIDFDVFVFDINGRLVLEGKSNQLLTKNLSKGVYLLQVRTNQKYYNKVFVKE